MVVLARGGEAESEVANEWEEQFEAKGTPTTVLPIELAAILGTAVFAS